MSRTVKSLLLGMLAGILEYYICLVFSIIPYFVASSVWFRLILGASFAAGIIIAVVALLYKNKFVHQTLLRWFFLFFSYVVSLLINAYLGTIHFLQELFNITVSSTTENVCGMLSLSFLFVMQGMCLVVVMVMAAVKLIKYRCLRRK